MPYYKECNLLFIHIPKTGGTCIDTQICKSRKRTLHTIFRNDLLPEPYKNISLQHQFYTTIYENRTILDINFDKIKIFTIVRNPYDRIISDLFWLGEIHAEAERERRRGAGRRAGAAARAARADRFKEFKVMKNKKITPEQVYNLIKNIYINNNKLDNHNQPQYKFITDKNCNLIPNIKIFKTEQLNKSNHNINQFLGFNIHIRRNNVNKDYSRYLNKKSISLINDFYKKDFELFDYKMKSAL
tara:strand:+ start:100 stop:828 length:729 start_codon:yes stop_codon:yes gene_type:complete